MRQLVKITSGKLRGRVVKTPGYKTHPMGGRERLALFNMLSVYWTQEGAAEPLAGAKVLDTYAGSGVLGFEALSRGAEEADLADKDARACAVMRENAEILGVAGRVKIYQKSMQSFIAAAGSRQYDVIFVDPPYDRINLSEALAVKQLLAPGGVIVLSSPRGMMVEGVGLRVLTTKVYAGARLTLLKL